MPRRLSIKNHKQEIVLYRRRIILLSIIVLGCICVLISRLAYLQLYQHKYYTTLSKKNLLEYIPIEPNRGLIYDRNGVLLAKNITSYSLSITPTRVSNVKVAIERVNEIIPITESEKELFLKQLGAYRRFEAIPLKMKLSEEELAKFYVNRYRLPGVSIQTQLIREYPLGNDLAHVLGYVGRINPEEADEIDATTYSGSHYIGKVGIEKYYETELHGKVGFEQVETDATGRPIRTLQQKPAVHGDDIYLTIDSRLQKIATEALKDYEGAIVVLSPKTGEILALVSMPNYDPNPFVTGLSHKQLKSLQSDPRRPLYHRAIHGRYPPASTIKPFIALQALNENITSSEESISDPGWFRLPGSKHTYHDWNPNGHGKVNLKRAIIESCDTYFYQLANKLGVSKLVDGLVMFGFGKKTNVDLKEEASGLMPTPGWKEANRGERWYAGDTVITGIGQGSLLTTPLQLAQATTIIANRGTSFLPHLLLKKRHPDQSETDFTPQIDSSITIDKKHWNSVINAMQRVVSSPVGTGHRFGKDSKYSVAGKTGTAQVFSSRNLPSQKELDKKLRDHELFIAFAPIKDPDITIAVLVEHEEKIATVLARKVLDAYFEGKRNER